MASRQTKFAGGVYTAGMGRGQNSRGQEEVVNLGCGFGAQLLWICLNRTSSAYMSRIRPIEVRAERGNLFGPPGRILEIPGQWHLTDFSPAEFVLGFPEGMRSAHGFATLSEIADATERVV